MQSEDITIYVFFKFVLLKQRNLLLQIPGDVDEVRRVLRQKKSDLGLSLQPHIIVIGKDLRNIDTISVELDKTTYSPPTLLKGLDILFKLFMAFNIAYPLETEHIWYFLQWKVFGITTKYDSHIPYIYESISRWTNLSKKKDKPVAPSKGRKRSVK